MLQLHGTLRPIARPWWTARSAGQLQPWTACIKQRPCKFNLQVLYLSCPPLCPDCVQVVCRFCSACVLDQSRRICVPRSVRKEPTCTSESSYKMIIGFGQSCILQAIIIYHIHYIPSIVHGSNICILHVSSVK